VGEVVLGGLDWRSDGRVEDIEEDYSDSLNRIFIYYFLTSDIIFILDLQQ
jgi:hypothetical protein